MSFPLDWITGEAVTPARRLPSIPLRRPRPKSRPRLAHGFLAALRFPIKRNRLCARALLDFMPIRKIERIEENWPSTPRPRYPPRLRLLFGEIIRGGLVLARDYIYRSGIRFRHGREK